MAWLLILLAAAALAAAFFSTSMVLTMLALVSSLGLLLVGVINLLADRVSSRIRDDAMMVDPVQLRHLREQANVRRDVGETSPAGAGGEP